MAIDKEAEMTDVEIDEFLGHRETGVLSLARTDDPYAIPISYGYDETERTLYLRLVSTPDSEKRSFLESTPRARLVVYDERESTYRSVIATGELKSIDPSDLTPEQIAQYGETKRPLFEIWAEGKDTLNIELYKLVPETLDGRRTEVDRSE